MSIVTQGFGVDVMPRYTPPNPSLVAFNPTQVSDGMLSAFNLAKAYEQVKSQKALQAELEATRQSRISKENALANLAALDAHYQTNVMDDKYAALHGMFQNQLASSNSNTRRLPSEEVAAIVGNETKAKVLPEVGMADIANARGQVATAGGRADAMNAANAVTTATAGSQIPAIIAENQARASVAPVVAAHTVQDLQAKMSLIPGQTQLSDVQTQDRIKNYQEDADVKRAQAKAEYAKTTAEINKLFSESSHMDAVTSNLDNPVQTALRMAAEANKEVQASSTYYQRLAGMQVLNPADKKGPLIPLNSLESVAYDTDKDGNLVPRTSWFKTTKVDPTTLGLLEDLKNAKNNRIEAEQALSNSRRAAIKAAARHNPDLVDNSPAAKATGGSPIFVQDKNGNWVEKK